MAKKRKSESKPAAGTRPSWKGHLKVSLVSCPVELYNATTRAEMVSFHLINPKTNNRIQMKPYDRDVGLVERGDLVHGYEIEKDRYVIVDDADLKNIQLESTRTLAVEKFVPEDSIDPIFFDTPYYLIPDGPDAAEAFAVIREAMRREHKTALARLVLANREHTVAISPRGKGMLLTMLRHHQELRDAKKLFDAIAPQTPKPAMIAIATKIIEDASGDFDPDEFKDRYEAALRDLVEKLAKGHKPVAIEEPESTTNVVDLMAALKASLKTRGKTFARGNGKRGEVVKLRRSAETARGKKAGAKRKRARS